MDPKIFVFLNIFSLLLSSISSLEKITIKGTNFVVDGKEIFMNGVNTLWDKQNDLARDYNEAFLDEYFKILHENGINSSTGFHAMDFILKLIQVEK